MSDFKDKITERERLYVYSVPLMFLIGFGLFLLKYVIGLDTEFEINGKSGIMINILGAIITGYSLSCECTIIHFMLNKIRISQGALKALFIILFIPSLLAGVLVSAILTIPYCYNCSKKITHIKMDNKGIVLNWQKISIIVLGIIDVIILIAYFVCQYK